MKEQVKSILDGFLSYICSNNPTIKGIGVVVYSTKTDPKLLAEILSHIGNTRGIEIIRLEDELTILPQSYRKRVLLINESVAPLSEALLIGADGILRINEIEREVSHVS